MSHSLKQFNDSLELSKSLKSIERTYPQNPSYKERPAVNALRGGSVILMVAAFEYYLKGLFEEQLTALNTNPNDIDFDKLPIALKLTSIYDGLGRALKGPRYKSIPKIDRLPGIISACKKIVVSEVIPDPFSETSSNPNGKTVKLLFKNVGVNEIFEKIKDKFEKKWHGKVVDLFIESKLDEIVNKRHIVAHTADISDLSRRSENEYLKFLKILATLLDSELSKHIKKLKKNAKI